MHFFVTKHTSETSLQVFSPVVTGMSQHVWKDPNLVNNSFGKTKRDPDTGSFYQYPGIMTVLHIIKFNFKESFWCYVRIRFLINFCFRLLYHYMMYPTFLRLKVYGSS